MWRGALFIFLIACLVPATSPCLFAGEDAAKVADPGETSLALPAANMDLENLVPLSIVKRIALEKAWELWGQVTAGESIACCDEDGDIVAYMCPFRIGQEPFPSYEQIMQGVREGRRLVKEVESGTALRPSGKLVEAHFQEAFKMVRKKELGIGEYGTIYVSARYDRYPIPLCSHYLCPYYTRGDLAQEKAKKILKGTPNLARYYFLGHRGQYFEFVSGESNVLIHVYSLEIEPIKPVERVIPTQEQLEDIRQDWIKITGTKETLEVGE